MFAVSSSDLGVQLEYVGSWVIFGSISAAAHRAKRSPTQPRLSISSAGSGGCSRSDRFSKHFKKCRNGESHLKAPVILLREDDRWT